MKRDELEPVLKIIFLFVEFDIFDVETFRDVEMLRDFEVEMFLEAPLLRNWRRYTSLMTWRGKNGANSIGCFQLVITTKFVSLD